MAQERKEYLKGEIINIITSLMKENNFSLEELEDGYAIVSNIMIDKDDLTQLQEDIDDK